MKYKKLEFPNPLLREGSEDYNDLCSFSINVQNDKISVDDENINVPVTYDLKCSGIWKLIKNSMVKVGVRAVSPGVSFAKVYFFEKDKKEMVIQIDKFSVIDKIFLTGYVAAVEEIHNFSSDGELNEIFFNGVTFDIRKGDILALDEGNIVRVDMSELEKPISSIVSIRRLDDISSDIAPVFEEDKIIINLKSDLYDNYCSLRQLDRGVFERFINAVVVYPVIVEALSFIKNIDNDNDAQDYREKRWFRAIQHKVQEKNIDILDKPLSVMADTLLGGICSDALKQLNIVNKELNSDESIDMMGGND